MSLPPAFWDSSGLIPLCVREATSPANETLAKQFSQVVWSGTLVEVRSAIARLHRSGTKTISSKYPTFGTMKLCRRWGIHKADPSLRSG